MGYHSPTKKQNALITLTTIIRLNKNTNYSKKTSLTPLGDFSTNAMMPLRVL